MTTNEKNELISRLQSATGLSADDKAALTRLLRTQQYGLVWEEKPEDVEELLRTQMPVLSEVKEKAIISDDPQAPDHILIEGDNLEALNALAYTHEGKVDVIYIDPPYNTGNKDFVYNDSFVDGEDGYRHSKWLSFMDKRLRLAKRMLSEKGVIFISIDDNEQANLKLLCDEIFGWDCFVGNVSWQRTYSIRNDSKGIPAEVEYILVYSKLNTWQPNKLPRTAEMNASYSNPDGDICDWMSGSPVAPGASTHQGMVYAIQHPFTGELFYPSKRACWRYEQSQMLEYMNGWCEYKLEDINDDAERANVCGIKVSEVKKGVKAIVLADSIEESRKKAQNVYDKGPWPRFYFTNKGQGGVRRKVYLDNVGGRIATNYWPYDETGHTDEAKKELIKIFGDAPFDTPKPSRLINRILMLGANKFSTILDFFAGSGTTLHATMQLNAEDGGHRQCILVTNNENNICEEVTYERNRRVILGYTNAKGKQVEGLTANNLHYYRVEHVNREPSLQNKRELMYRLTDIFCINEGIYTEKKELGTMHLKSRYLRYFEDDGRGLLVLFEPRAIVRVVQELKTLPKPRMPIHAYVFAEGDYPFNEMWEEVADRLNVIAQPNAYIRTLSRTLPPIISDEWKVADNLDDEEREQLMAEALAAAENTPIEKETTL